jgi:hypothetical protein
LLDEGGAGRMCETRNRVAVSPSPREAGNGWVLDAVFPNGEQAAIAGFSTASEANNWLGSAGHLSWLRDSRTTFGNWSAGEIFQRLASGAIAVSDLALEFCTSIRRRWRDMEALRVEYRRISSMLAQLNASARLCLAFNLPGRTSKPRRAGRSAPSFRRRTVYRRLSAATALLLVFVTALGILLVVFVALEHGERPATSTSRATQFTADRAIAPSHLNETTQASDPIALLIDRVSSSKIATDPATEPAAESPPPQSAREDVPAGDIPAATSPRDLPQTALPGIVGVWAPETGSCSAREGVLPAVINERGARAGATSCVFKERRWTERDFRTLANCTNGQKHWTSNVRLVVKGDRLVWMSKRGTQAYTRCKSNI